MCIFISRKYVSKSMALLELIEKMESATDNTKSSIYEYLYTWKQVDTVNHNLLLNSYLCGVCGVVDKWLNSYFEKRIESYI